MSNCAKTECEPRCPVNPSPFYAHADYTLFTPGQAEPKLDADGLEVPPGWDVEYNISSIVWEKNPCAPACMPCVENMGEWIDWIQANIVSFFCDWASKPCHWMIGGQLVKIGESMASCLGNTTTLNTVVFSETKNQAVAGKIVTEANCPLFMRALKNCVAIAPAGDSTVKLLGRHPADARKPYIYKLSSQPTTRILQNFIENDGDNLYPDAPQGQRLVPKAERQQIGAPNEGNSYNVTTGGWYIGKAGFYRLNFSTFVDVDPNGVTWSGLDGLYYVLSGIVVELANKNLSETRLFQAPYWREHRVSPQRVHVHWSIARKFEAGTKVTPRIWNILPTAQDVLGMDLSAYSEPLGGAQIGLFRIPDADVAF